MSARAFLYFINDEFVLSTSIKRNVCFSFKVSNLLTKAFCIDDDDTYTPDSARKKVRRTPLTL